MGLPCPVKLANKNAQNLLHGGGHHLAVAFSDTTGASSARGTGCFDVAEPLAILPWPFRQGKIAELFRVSSAMPARELDCTASQQKSGKEQNRGLRPL
jgi:hypothetical protein